MYPLDPVSSEDVVRLKKKPGDVGVGLQGRNNDWMINDWSKYNIGLLILRSFLWLISTRV